MRNAATGLLMYLGAVSCLAAEPDAGDRGGQVAGNGSTVEEVLDNPLADEDYREERACLWRRAIDDVEIVDEGIVVFRGRVKNKIWVNRLSRRCVGLRRDMVVTTHSRTGSICQLDTIDARPRNASPFERPVRCRLGGFQAIDEMQVEAMKRAVDEHAKSSRKHGKAGGNGN